MMQKGSSIPWSKVLYELTDGQTDKIDPKPILDYFKPLHEWLLLQNLTLEDWNCEDFLDRQNLSVKSYDNMLLEMKQKSSAIVFKPFYKLLYSSLFLVNLIKINF